MDENRHMTQKSPDIGIWVVRSCVEKSIVVSGDHFHFLTGLCNWHMGKIKRRKIKNNCDDSVVVIFHERPNLTYVPSMGPELMTHSNPKRPTKTANFVRSKYAIQSGQTANDSSC